MQMNTSKAVEEIIADLTDRRGLSGEWDQIDEDIQQEIMTTWRGILDNLDTGCGCDCGACFHCTRGR